MTLELVVRRAVYWTGRPLMTGEETAQRRTDAQHFVKVLQARVIKWSETEAIGQPCTLAKPAAILFRKGPERLAK